MPEYNGEDHCLESTDTVDLAFRVKNRWKLVDAPEATPFRWVAARHSTDRISISLIMEDRSCRRSRRRIDGPNPKRLFLSLLH